MAIFPAHATIVCVPTPPHRTCPHHVQTARPAQLPEITPSSSRPKIANLEPQVIRRLELLSHIASLHHQLLCYVDQLSTSSSHIACKQVGPLTQLYNPNCQLLIQRTPGCLHGSTTVPTSHAVCHSPRQHAYWSQKTLQAMCHPIILCISHCTTNSSPFFSKSCHFCSLKRGGSKGIEVGNLEFEKDKKKGWRVSKRKKKKGGSWWPLIGEGAAEGLEKKKKTSCFSVWVERREK